MAQSDNATEPYGQGHYPLHQDSHFYGGAVSARLSRILAVLHSSTSYQICEHIRHRPSNVDQIH